jgi:ABC-type sugar transport system permease subunit
MLGYTLPPVIIGAIWKYILDPRYGPFFGYLRQLGLVEGPVFWSIDPTISLAAITGVMAWTIWPFMFLILYASRQGIPDSYYEAAKVYGAGGWARFRYITLPQLKSAILVVVALRVIWNLSEVSQPLTLTGGGPGYDTSILGIYLYRLLIQARLGLASASGVILFAVSLIGVVLFFRSYSQEVEF